MKFETYKNLKTEYFYLKSGKNEVQICVPVINRVSDYNRPKVFTVINGEYTKSYDATSLEEAKRIAELMFSVL